MRLLTILSFAACLAFSCKSTKTETYESADSTVQTRGAVERGDRPAKGQKGRRPSIDEVFKMDTNNDGLLSLTEVGDSPLSKRFVEIDSNGDGAISRTEFENAPKPERGQRPRKQ